MRDADRIIVMKEGVVVEDGRHETLNEANGVYAELVRSQQFDKKRQPSASSSTSLHKEARSIPNERTESLTVEAPLASTQQKSAMELILRSLSMSRHESPAIVIGILSSILSGSIIIGEVSSLHSIPCMCLGTGPEFNFSLWRSRLFTDDALGPHIW